MKIDGNCYCGQIAYTAEIDPATVTICHCTDCQTLSGTAYRVNIPAKAEHFTITRGTPRIYVKTADSGNRRAQAFCADCGTNLYATAADDTPSVYALRVGTIAQRDALPAKKQIWCASAQPWAMDITALPGVARQS